MGVEVRVAGRPYPQVDLDQSCATLSALRFADCWSRLAEIRVWKDNPRTTPWFKQVELTPASTTDGCRADPYFARTGTSCRYTVAVNVDWLDRDDDELDFSLTINGTALTPAGPTASGWWTSNGPIVDSTLGASPVRLTWSWSDRDRTQTWGTTACTNAASTPCQGSAADIPVHHLFLASDTNAAIVDVVRTSQAPQAPSGQPGFPLHSIFASGSAITVFPTIGLRSALTAGQYRVLRSADSQGNQSVDCEPAGGQGHDFEMFQLGCKPFFGFNRFGLPDRGVWWAAQSPAACPNKTTIFAQPNDESDAGAWFVAFGEPGGAVDETLDCIAGDITPCRAIPVR